MTLHYKETKVSTKNSQKSENLLLAHFLTQLNMYICFICPFTGLIHICFCILIPISFPRENNICIGICTLCKTEQPLQEMKLQEREEENKGN